MTKKAFHLSKRLALYHKVLSHCLSHLLPPEKHHLGLRPRGHSYTLPICPNKLCKFSFILRCLFCFLWLLTVFSITVFTVFSTITFASVICSNKDSSCILCVCVFRVWVIVFSFYSFFDLPSWWINALYIWVSPHISTLCRIPEKQYHSEMLITLRAWCSVILHKPSQCTIIVDYEHL